MNTEHEPVIRCWSTPLALVTLAVVQGPRGRGYALEVRAWGGTTLRVVLAQQGVAQRLGRRIARRGLPEGLLGWASAN